MTRPRFVILCAIILLLAGCIHTRHRAVVADTAIAGALFTLQDTEMAMYQAGQISLEQHKNFNTALLPALKAGHDLNTALMNWKDGQDPPIELKYIVDAVQHTTQAVVLALPPEQRDKLLPLILAIQQSVLTVLLLTAGGQ